MAFTSTDLTTVETAIMDLASGKRVVQVDFGGKTRSFQATSIEKLQKLRNIIKSDINAAGGDGFMQNASFRDPT